MVFRVLWVTEARRHKPDAPASALPALARRACADLSCRSNILHGFRLCLASDKLVYRDNFNLPGLDSLLLYFG